ncbi:RAMP superfamily CRISPR-associated protein [Nocardia sp. NPDC058705]|uniref:RAMP superfamily CRISPR-associated protein n=1 Tax=Nocardia sp. NPDC058705 TaxID=3346609 RepID=UPI0036784DFB
MSTLRDSESELRRFAGVGGLAPAYDLLLLTATLTTTADTTIADSSAQDALSDIVVHRDPHTGAPMIPATAQSGVLRHALAARLDRARVGRVFGVAPIDESGIGYHPAALCPHDMLARTTSTRRRTGNAVDPATRTVRPGGVFTVETVPAGTEFDLVWQVWLPRPDDPATATAAATIVDTVAAAGALLDAGHIRFGQRTRAGRGAVTTKDWQVRWLALTNDATDAEAWYSTPYDRIGDLTNDAQATPRLRTALTVLRTRWAACTPDTDSPWCSPLPEAPPPPTGDRVVVTGQLRVAETVAGSVLASTVRTVPGEYPVDSGSAVKALLRATASRVVEFVAASLLAPDAEPSTAYEHARERGRALVRDLFGTHPADPDFRLATPSRLSVNELPLSDAVPVVFDRVPINPLTRATIPGRKGVVAAHYGGSRLLRIEAVDVTAAERGLLMLVVRDLRDGLAAATGPHRRQLESVGFCFHTTGSTRELSWTETVKDPSVHADVAALVTEITRGTP